MNKTSPILLPTIGNLKPVLPSINSEPAEGSHDRGKINSILRLEGITDYITMTIDDTVVCEKAVFKI
jgi:hypothetical protein